MPLITVPQPGPRGATGAQGIQGPTGATGAPAGVILTFDNRRYASTTTTDTVVPWLEFPASMFTLPSSAPQGAGARWVKYSWGGVFVQNANAKIINLRFGKNTGWDIDVGFDVGAGNYANLMHWKIDLEVARYDFIAPATTKDYLNVFQRAVLSNVDGGTQKRWEKSLFSLCPAAGPDILAYVWFPATTLAGDVECHSQIVTMFGA